MRIIYTYIYIYMYREREILYVYMCIYISAEEQKKLPQKTPLISFVRI